MSTRIREWNETKIHEGTTRRPTRINIPFIPICQESHSQRRLISVFHGKLPPKQYGGIVKKRAWIQHLSSLIKYHCFVSAERTPLSRVRFCLPVSRIVARSETISLLNWSPILVCVFVFMSVGCVPVRSYKFFQRFVFEITRFWLSSFGLPLRCLL